MKKMFLLLVMCFYFVAIYAQNYTVKLKLIEKTNFKPIEFVSCEVKTTEEQAKTVAFALTDSLGNAFFELPKGKYDINAVYMGQILFAKKIELIDNLDLGQISVSQSVLLSELAVKEYRSSLKTEKGRLIFDVKNSPLSKDYSANELLVRTPLVKMSGAGLSIDGGAAELRINGVKQNLSGTALIAYLNSLKSDEVKQIEVQAGRTADVDASLSGGIINIVLDEKRGVKGYIESTGKYNGKSYQDKIIHLFSGSAGAGVTAGTKSLQFYANISGSGGQSHGVKYKSEYLIKPTGSFIQQNSKSPYSFNQYINANSGLSYKLNKNNTLNIEVAYNTVPTSRVSKNGNVRLSEQESFIDSLLTSSETESKSSQYALTASHLWKSSNKKSKLTTVLNYLYNKDEIEQNIQTFYQIQPNSSNELNLMENNSSMFYAQTKYDYTSENKIHVIVGAKYTRTERENHYEFTSDNAKNLGNHYVFTEQLPAAFINIDKKLSNGLFLSVGLRGEYTNLKSDNSETKVDYFDLFPSLLVSYKLKNNLSLRLNYSISIWRPAFSLLNNYRIKLSDFRYSVGNPKLAAQKTNFIKIGCLKKSHSLSLSYSYSANPIAELMYTEDNIVFVKNINLGEKHSSSFNYGYNGKIFPIWYLSANAGISYINFPKNIYEKEIFQAYISLYNNIKISEKFKCNINSKYGSPWIMNDRKVDDRFSLSANVRYSITPSFTANLGVNNLLRKGDSRSITDNIYTHYDYWRETAFRVYYLGFVYNFSKGEKVRTQKIRNENMDRYRV